MIKKWWRKIQKKIICLASIGLCSVSTGYITSCKQSKPDTGEFNVVFDGDTSLATFVNFTAKIGQDYVSVVRFKNEKIDFSELTILCGGNILPSECFKYDNVRNELTIYGNFITTNDLVIHFALYDEEVIIEPEKEVKGLTALFDGHYQSSVDIGPFELLNSDQSPKQLNVTATEVGSDVLGHIVCDIDQDDTTPNLFYLSINFTGGDYDTNNYDSITGYVPPGDWHLKITIRNDTIAKDLIVDSEYVVSFKTSILDIQIPNKNKAIVAEKYILPPHNLKSKIVLPYENNSGFYVVNPPKSLDFNDIKCDIKILGSEMTLGDIPLSGLINSFGFSLIDDFNMLSGKYQLDIIFFNRDDGTILYENKRDFTLDVNLDIIPPHNEQQQTFGIEQFDSSTNQFRIKVTFGSHSDPFVMFNAGYITSDLLIDVEKTGYISYVPDSAQIHPETVEMNTFSLSMEFYTPNLNHGSLENIKFNIRTKDEKYTYTLTNFKIKFKLQTQWEDTTAPITNVLIDKSNEAGANYSVGIFTLPTFLVYFPPLDLFNCIKINITQTSTDGNESIGETGIYKIIKVGAVKYQCVCYFKNITLFQYDWSTSLDITLSLDGYEEKIDLKGKQLTIAPLLMYDQPEDGTEIKCSLFVPPKWGSYVLGYVPNGDIEKVTTVSAAWVERQFQDTTINLSGKLAQAIGTVNMEIHEDKFHTGCFMDISTEYIWDEIIDKAKYDNTNATFSFTTSLIGEGNYKIVYQSKSIHIHFDYNSL